MTVVKNARRTLSQMACQSISLARQGESVLFENAAAARAQKEGAKIRRRLRRFQDNAALLDFRVSGERDFPVTSLGAHRRGEGQRKRDDAGLGRAAFHELQ